MARQLINLPGSLKLENPRYNPRPAGVIRQGSATEAVLEVLREQYQFLTHFQIQMRTKRTQKALSWALIYLHSQKLIERSSDESRNSRYYRYRIVPQKKD